MTPALKNGDKMACIEKVVHGALAFKWNYSIAMYVMGSCPSLLSFSKFFNLAWPSISKPTILFQEGYFIVHCFNEEDFNSIKN